jgi:hypothetical protein
MPSTAIYTDPTGQQVPAKYVKPYERLRDRIATQIAREWQAEEARLKSIKERTLALVEKLQAASATEADIKALGGKQGYIQFRSFDGSITVRVDNAKRTEFDERLAQAQALIMEAVRELTAGDHSADLVEIATKAFQPRASGNLDMQRIRDLRKYNVKHPKWVKACEIIAECERVIGHRRYIRVSVRQSKDAQPTSIILDIAAI